jgi:hypothetical protein
MVRNWPNCYRGLPHSNQEPCRHNDNVISNPVIIIQFNSTQLLFTCKLDSPEANYKVSKVVVVATVVVITLKIKVIIKSEESKTCTFTMLMPL